jgi:hypothetical protein
MMLYCSRGFHVHFHAEQLYYRYASLFTIKIHLSQFHTRIILSFHNVINIKSGVFCGKSFINFRMVRVMYLIFKQTHIIEYKTSHDHSVHKNYQTSINVFPVPHKFFTVTQCLHQGPSAIRQCTSAKVIWHRNLNHFSWTDKSNIIMINTEMVSSKI